MSGIHWIHILIDLSHRVVIRWLLSALTEEMAKNTKSEVFYVGRRFGHLSVIDPTIKYNETKTNKLKAVMCECDCHSHTRKLVSIYHLKSGHTTSCGCVRNQTHRLSHTKIYQQYYGMRKRCDYPKHKEYERYGGRGIKVCQEWTDSFENFYSWAIRSGYREGLTIDRIDNNGDYSPSNCRLISLSEQQQNKGNSIRLSFNGHCYGLKMWAEISGIKYQTLLKRYHKCSDPEYVLRGWCDKNEQ